MQIVRRDGGLDLRPRRERQIGIYTGNPDLALANAHRQELLVAELLRHHESAGKADLMLVHWLAQPDVLRAHADADQASDAGAQGRGKARRNIKTKIIAGE